MIVSLHFFCHKVFHLMKFFQIVAEILLNAEKTELFVAMFVNYVIIVLEINVFAHLQIFEDWLK